MPDTSTEQCSVPANDALFQHYHDTEWGVPTHCEQAIFEKICLEGFQSGLSWRTILHRREGFRRAFNGFTPDILRLYDNSDVDRLMADTRIIRNKRKILSVINNAHRLAELQQDIGSLADFVWSFKPLQQNRPIKVTQQWLRDNPSTADSAALSKALKQRGWSFVGPTNLYAMMQALGIVNDHLHSCPRRVELDNQSPGEAETA